MSIALVPMLANPRGKGKRPTRAELAAKVKTLQQVMQLRWETRLPPTLARIRSTQARADAEQDRAARAWDESVLRIMRPTRLNPRRKKLGRWVPLDRDLARELRLEAAEKASWAMTPRQRRRPRLRLSARERHLIALHQFGPKESIDSFVRGIRRRMLDVYEVPKRKKNRGGSMSARRRNPWVTSMSGAHKQSHGGGAPLTFFVDSVHRASQKKRSKPRRRKAGIARRTRSHARRATVKRRALRDRFGRFLKRSRSAMMVGRGRKWKPARRAPVRARRYRKPVRYHLQKRRGRYGRYVTKYSPAYVRRAQRRPTKTGRHYRSIRRIPGQRLVAGLIRLNPRTGELIMSRKAVVANPRRRRNGRRLATVTNRRRKRRNPRARRRSNPGITGAAMGTLKTSAMPMALGALGGAAVGYIDAKFLSDKPMATVASKFLLGLAGAIALRRRPMLAMGWAGGCFGTLGYSYGVKMGGGLVAHSSFGALQGVASMADANPEMAAMLAGMGDVVADNGLGDATDEYSEALGDVVDDMGDVVEGYGE